MTSDTLISEFRSWMGPSGSRFTDAQLGKALGDRATPELLLSTADVHDRKESRTITVDLDGTLAEKVEPFDPTQVGPPREGAAEFVDALKKIASRVVILTARKHLEPVRKWVRENHIPVDGVTNKKEPALCHIDDKGVNAQGALSLVLAHVKTFLKGGQQLSTLYFPDVGEAFAAGLEAGSALLLDTAPGQVMGWDGPYTGPMGGTYWLSKRSRRKVYSKTDPGEAAHEGPSHQYVVTEAGKYSSAHGTPEEAAKEIQKSMRQAARYGTNLGELKMEEEKHGTTTTTSPTAEPLAAAGASGTGGRLPAEERSGGEPGTAPEKLLPEPSAGTGERPEVLPSGEGGGSAEPGVPADRPGGPAGVGKGTGDEPAVPGTGAAVAEVLQQPPTPETPTDLSAGNWRYHTRDFFGGSLKDKFRNNIAAIKTLNALSAEGRNTATPAEQEILSKYVGWGQFPAIFNDYYDQEDLQKQREEMGLAEPEKGEKEAEKAWESERKELKGLLDDDAWKSARRSTLNAHFTHPDIVDAHWQMARRLGYTGGGRFLETSAGSGYYMGLMPADMAGSTRTSAVELDSTTGKIAKLLYPGAKVHVQGFQDYLAPDDFFDIIASNVPFGRYTVHDKDYNKFKASIHDYFFLKSADKVRPGGLVMHITSTGTLDKGDAAIREELAKTCDLVQAIRFPGGAHAENAGTQVVTDMLILRKRLPGEKPGDQSWLQTTTVPDPDGGDPIPINKYFADHPEQVLGRVDRSGTMYRAENVNVNLASPEELTEKLGQPVSIRIEPDGKRRFIFADGSRVPTADLQRVGGELFRKKLRDAVERVPEGIYTHEKASEDRFSPERLPAPGEVKDGGYHVEKGKLFMRIGGALVEQKTNSKELARIQGQLGIRDAMREIVNLESRGEDSAEPRGRLNQTYDAYVAKWGSLNEKMNRRAMAGDPDHPNLLSLEAWDAKTGTARKAAAMFTKETIRHIPKVTSAANAADGLGISLHESGRVDIDHIARLTGQHKETIAKELVEKGHAYEDPQDGWKPADQYLSGNVRRKLTLARAAAAADPKYKANVEALEKVQPEDVDHTEIDVRLGAPWVPPSDIAAFAAELTGTRAANFDIGHYSHNGEWVVKSGVRSEAWSTDRMKFVDLLEAALNNKPVTVYDDHKAVNPDATREAQAKVQEIKDAFFTQGTGWIWDDDERRERLVRYYNDNFNNIRPIRYDGSHQTFPGMNPNFKPHPHIPNAVWQVVSTGKALFGHEVGTGKTTVMLASAMELRRLGLARKPCIACLKANIEQITQEALKLYPGAKIITTAEMFDAKKRQQAMARIASGDYDMVIMTHDHLNKLRMKPEQVAKFIQEEMDGLTTAIVEARQDDPKGQGRIVKDLEKAHENLRTKLQEALNEKVKDNTVFFEDTGIDQLFVDESHFFKSLPCYTKMGNVKGIPTRRSQRATNMLMRTRWLLERNGDRGVVFATGTPITNTMGEMFNNMRYLQPKELQERGLQAFDSWAATFGDVQTKGEFNVAGQYRPTARFRSFTNVNELMQIAGQTFDIQRVATMRKAPPEGIEIQGKKFEGGQAIPPSYFEKATDEEKAKLLATIKRPDRKDSTVVSPDTPAMQALMKNLVDRAESVSHRSGPPQKGDDNMLVICTDGRKGALDMRLLNPNAPDDPNSKTNLLIKNVLDIARNNPGKTQLIFSDLGVHETGLSVRGAVAGAEEVEDTAGEDIDQEELDRESVKASKFNLYGDIIEKLVRGGIPREKIADFSQLSGAKKEEAQDAMRRGDMLVGIGSSKKMGTGVNLQNKVHTMHHLDVPWLPAELEQRDGRGWRFGNENAEVGVVRYIAEKSLDQKFWDILSAKHGFIKQIMESGGKGIRSIKDEDTETLSYEQLTAIASGDPRIMEKVELDEEVKNLGYAETRHAKEKLRLEKSIKRSEAGNKANEALVAKREQDLAAIAAHPEFEAEIGGQKFTERKGVDEALGAALKAYQDKAIAMDSWQYSEQEELRNKPLGTYKGMSIYPTGKGEFSIAGPSGERWTTGPSLQSIEYVARNTIAKWKGFAEESVAKVTADIENTKKRLAAYTAFPRTEELKAKRARLAQITAELEASGKPESLRTEETYSGGPAPGSREGGGSSVGTIAAVATPGPPTPAPAAPAPAAPAKTHVTVSGNTFTHKEAIKAAGGRWDPDRKVWKVPVGRADKLRKLSGLRLLSSQLPSDEGFLLATAEEFSIAWSPDVLQLSLADLLPHPLRAIGEAYRSLMKRLRKEPESPQTWEPTDVDRYMMGHWLPVTSSNVASIRYLGDENALEVEFHGGRPEEPGFYRYDQIPPAMARDFAKAASFGRWVWDNLRVRGTRYGHKKPYTFISGPSVYQPSWMKSEASRQAHGLMHMSSGWKAQFLWLATAHAPGGQGIDIAGKHFAPGEFIPGADLARATPEQKSQLHVKGEGHAPGENEYHSKPYLPDPTAPNPRTGIPDHARVGVPAMGTPPPPNLIPRLPNLSDKQREVETRFAEKYLADPDKMVGKYLKALRNRKIGEHPNVFATDDVKALNRDWNPKKLGAGDVLDKDTKKAMARYNAAIHQTANAIAKKAFLKHLDDVVAKYPEGDPRRSVLATNGGCASGKGSTLARSTNEDDPHFGMLPAAELVGAIWDAAGEQNATENAWIYEECQKRGIKATFAYVWADPKDTWEAPDRGVIRRAMRKGRMVDARLFADSYAHGAKNMKAFHDRYKGKPGANFIFIDNRQKAAPKLLNDFPQETLAWDAETIYRDAVASLKVHKHNRTIDKSLIEGGLIGTKIWGPPQKLEGTFKFATGFVSEEHPRGQPKNKGVEDMFT